MPYFYDHSRYLEARFDKALELIANNKMNAEQLSLALEVSLPTTHRIITALRRRGHNIKSINSQGSWSYKLFEDSNG